MITIKKQTLYYWLAIFILQVLFVAWHQGLLVPDTVKPDMDSVVPPVVPVVPDELVMTATQASSLLAATKPLSLQAESVPLALLEQV